MKHETVKEIQERMKADEQKIREMKRADSEVECQLRQEYWPSPHEEDIRANLKACYDYIGQHRALFKKSKFKKLDGRD